MSADRVCRDLRREESKQNKTTNITLEPTVQVLQVQFFSIATEFLVGTGCSTNVPGLVVFVSRESGQQDGSGAGSRGLSEAVSFKTGCGYWSGREMAPSGRIDEPILFSVDYGPKSSP